MQESPGVARRVGAQAVAHQVHVAHLPARSDQHVDDEAQLGAHHSGVGDRLVVVGRRGASSPRHYNDIEVILCQNLSTVTNVTTYIIYSYSTSMQLYIGENSSLTVHSY